MEHHDPLAVCPGMDPGHNRYPCYPRRLQLQGAGQRLLAAGGGDSVRQANLRLREAAVGARGGRSDEQRQQGHGEDTRQQRHRRVQPDDRLRVPCRRSYPVEAEREREFAQRQRRPKAAARFLSQPPEHRPALPGVQPGQQVNRDPPRTALGPAVQAGSIVGSGRKVLIANANHSTVRSHMPNPVRMQKAREIRLSPCTAAMRPAGHQCQDERG